MPSNASLTCIRSATTRRWLLFAFAFLALIAIAPRRADAAITRTIPGGYQASVDLAKGADFAASPRGAVLLRFAGSGATSYSSSAASISKESVDVDFGALASVHLGFRPDGPPKSESRANRICRAGKALAWTGVFAGSVRIRAVYGFRPLRTRSFHHRGTLYLEPRLRCRFPDPDPNYEPKPGNQVELGASSCEGRYFAAHTERDSGALASSAVGGFIPRRYVSYSASASIKLPGVIVSEAISVQAPISSFVFDEELTSASVSPPRPFHGTATFSRAEDGSTSWAGSLSARILGRKFPLAGLKFQSHLTSFQLPPGSGVQVAVSAPPC